MKNLVLFVLLLSFSYSWSQEQELPSDSSVIGEKHKRKTGFNLGALPVVAYDSDVGFKYGALANFYFYGDGSTYPQYRHAFNVEWSRTTKGSGINQIIYDSEYLIPKTRVTAEASYLTEKAIGFYGFNGYNAIYNADLTDDSEGNTDYLSRVYYKHERAQLALKADFQRELMGKKLRVLLGYSFYNTHIASVDVDQLNEGKDASEMLPDTMGLYDKYVAWGAIKEAEKDGGNTHMFRTGLVYDTRDQEGNPMKGMWTEALILYAPAFTSSESAYAKLAITHRQYFTLKKEVLNLAYRVSYQPKIAGDIPFYMLPFVYNSKRNRDGLGGARTLRGILRNRIVGEDLLFTNIETRWKFYRGIVLNQNIYLALNAFVDAGMVTNAYEFDKAGIPEAELQNIKTGTEGLHTSYGLGFAFVMNHNFIVNINYGRAVKAEDGKDGFYVVINYMF